MILTDGEIESAIKAGDIVFDGFKPENLGSNSVDVCLGDKLITYRNNALFDPALKIMPDGDEIHIGEAGVQMNPGMFFLGNTAERIGSSKYVCCIVGKSSNARCGLSIHQTAGFGDLGFVGYWTLEFNALRPVILRAGMKIGQVYFYKTESEVIHPYDSAAKKHHYMNQPNRPVPAYGINNN